MWKLFLAKVNDVGTLSNLVYKTINKIITSTTAHFLRIFQQFNISSTDNTTDSYINFSIILTFLFYRFDWLYIPLSLYGKVLLKKLRIHNKMF